MRWCKSCLLPDSRPNLDIDQTGVCSACRQAESNAPATNATLREEEFDQVVIHAKARSQGHDCVIPVSGGKDSIWQVITCLEAGLTPLAVTWKTPGRTAIGQENLDCLVKLGVDHIDWQINPDVEARFMLEAFRRYGSTAIPMHMAIFSIPLIIARRFRIPLIVWGENSAAEYGKAEDVGKGFLLDDAWLRKYGVTHGTTAADWIKYGFSAGDMASYTVPPADPDFETRAVFLGYYKGWDPYKSLEAAQKAGFKSGAENLKTGRWDFADLDDDFISLHHWMKWYKFGFTRAFDNLSVEIRKGHITRADAMQVLEQEIGHDQRPDEDIKKFCDFAGIQFQDFLDIAERYRNRDIWRQDENGCWVIPGFPVKNWKWS